MLRPFLVLYYLGEYHLIGYKPIVELEARISFGKTGALNHAIKNTNVKTFFLSLITPQSAV
jgi:hypothetical protein